MAGSGLTLDLFENDGLDDNMKEWKDIKSVSKVFWSRSMQNGTAIY